MKVKTETCLAGRVEPVVHHDKRQTGVFVVFERVVEWLDLSASKFHHHGI